MLLLNKKGFAKIICKKGRNVIKACLSPTQLTAKFNELIDTQNNIITPVWIIECNNINCFDIKESDDNNNLFISTLCDNNTGEIVKVTLIDKEQNYVCDSIELEVISL